MEIIKMSPFKISILIHYYSTPGDYPNLDMTSKAWEEAVECFYNAGIFGKGSDGKPFVNDEALRVYMDALMKVPLPKQVWTCQ